jgi:hypothetical protein
MPSTTWQPLNADNKISDEIMIVCFFMGYDFIQKRKQQTLFPLIWDCLDCTGRKIKRIGFFEEDVPQKQGGQENWKKGKRSLLNEEIVLRFRIALV